jgi:hypothetical protein
MLSAPSTSSKLILVMGKTNDIECARIFHHLPSDSDNASTTHMETPTDERTKKHEDIQQLSSANTHSACVTSSTSSELASDIDTSSIIWHDLVMKGRPTVGTITTAIDLVTKETIAASSQCPNPDGYGDIGRDTGTCRVDAYRKESSDATAKPMNAMLPPKRIMNSPRSALTVVSVNSNIALSCSDEGDDSEVFADVIYAPEIFRESSVRRPRSIRFSDEKEGTTLATIHLIPWTEDDDANWLPRLEKSRMEL